MLTAAGFCESSVSSRNASGTLNRSISVDPTGRSEGFSAVLYNNTNGLPTSEANAIAETNDGFIWIGGYSGLIRYDGNTFLRLNSTMGIASVISLYVDHLDRLWIGTNDAGIAVMEHGTFTQWGQAEGLNSLRINSMVEDEKGNLYAATITGIVVIDPDMKLSYINDPRLTDAYTDNLRIGSDGTIYGVTISGDIFCIRDKEVTQFYSHEENSIQGVCYVLPDPETPGQAFFGTGGSDVYRGALGGTIEEMTAWDISPLFNVSSMEYIDGQLWLTAENGIGTLNGDSFSRLDNVPMGFSVENMITDYEGNLWFTSTRQEVMKVVPNQFSNLFDRYELPTTVVNSTCMYGDALFMGTDVGLQVLNKDGLISSIPLTKAETASGNQMDATDLIQLLEGKKIRSIIRDSKGRLWISTWKSLGLLRYSQDEVVAFTQEDGLLSNRVRAVYEREDGSMLVVNTGGVSIIEGDQVVSSYGKDDGIVNAESLTVVEGFHGEIILGSDGNGIYVIGENGTQNITIQDGLASGIIMRLKPDPAHRIYWIVTSNSLAYMTEDYKVMTIREFPYSNNYDLYENSKGDMWILASNGIYVVPADELIANGSITPVYYGIGNVVPGIATGNSYSELTPDGELIVHCHDDGRNYGEHREQIREHQRSEGIRILCRCGRHAALP